MTMRRNSIILFIITSSFLSGNSQGPLWYVFNFNTKQSLSVSFTGLTCTLVTLPTQTLFTTRVLPPKSDFCNETCELYELLLWESQLLGTSTMLDKRLLSSTITTSRSPFTCTYIGDKNRFNGQKTLGGKSSRSVKACKEVFCKQFTSMVKTLSA